MSINRKGLRQMKNEKCKSLLDKPSSVTILCYVIVVVEKENNKAIIVDITSPWDHRVH